MFIDENLNDEIQDDVEEIAEESDGGESSGKQGLSQAQIDKIVADRLARERKKYADYDDLKEIAENLKKYGYSGSIKEIKEQIAQAVQAESKEKELEKLEEEAELYGTSPELVKQIKDLKKEINSMKSKEQEAAKVAAAEQERYEQWQIQKSEFETAYPDIDLKSLAQNQKFMKFAQKANPSLTLLEVYNTYTEMVGETEAETLAKVSSKAARATHSGKGKNSAETSTYGLTTSQQELARKGGMTFKEYATRLKEIQ